MQSTSVVGETWVPRGYTVRFRESRNGPWIETGIDEPERWRAEHAWRRMCVGDYYCARVEVPRD